MEKEQNQNVVPNNSKDNEQKKSVVTKRIVKYSVIGGLVIAAFYLGKSKKAQDKIRSCASSTKSWIGNKFNKKPVVGESSCATEGMVITTEQKPVVMEPVEAAVKTAEPQQAHYVPNKGNGNNYRYYNSNNK